MTTSIHQLQQQSLLHTITSIGRHECDDGFRWVVYDADSKVIVENVAGIDNLLKLDVIGVKHIEDDRPYSPQDPVVYFLSPKLHIVKWLIADMSRKRYGKTYVVWTSDRPPEVEAKLREAHLRDEAQVTLNIEYFAQQESQLITLRDPQSFQILFNPKCKELVATYLQNVAQKIVSLCLSLGETPLIRYLNPNPRHQNTNYATELSCYLANIVEQTLKKHTEKNKQRAPSQTPSNGQPSPPRPILLITDRTMDLMAPLVHELTYQAMAMDLLEFVEEDGKIKYVKPEQDSQGVENAQYAQTFNEEDIKLTEEDKVWVGLRHMDFRNALTKIGPDLKAFIAANPHFNDKSNKKITVNALQDMAAGLGRFVRDKEVFAEHISIAGECARAFTKLDLEHIVNLEEIFSIGLDENDQIPKDVARQLVRFLGNENVSSEIKIRLLMMYIICRDGILDTDVSLLLHLGGFSASAKKKKAERHELDSGEHYFDENMPDENRIYNMRHMGTRVPRKLGDNTNVYDPLYPYRKRVSGQEEEFAVPRFEPMLRYALEGLCNGDLDTHQKFPILNPDPTTPNQQETALPSLRYAGKATWAVNRPAATKARQRIIVFMAGGATYSEARVCYDISQQTGKEVFLATTHMLTPKLYLQEMSRLHRPPDALDLPIVRPPPANPKWMNVPLPGATGPQKPSGSRLPMQEMQNMSLNTTKPSKGSTNAGSFNPHPDPHSGKLKKEKDKDKDKKHHIRLNPFKKH